MDINEFYEHIFQKQQEALEMPSNKKIAKWAVDLIHLLFPERDSQCFRNAGEVEIAFKNSEAELYDLLTKTKACDDRSEERRVGKECRDRCWPNDEVEKKGSVRKSASTIG